MGGEEDHPDAPHLELAHSWITLGGDDANGDHARQQSEGRALKD
jgi:hypothetical protein